MRCKICGQVLTKIEIKWLKDKCSWCDRERYFKKYNDKNRLQKNNRVTKAIND